MLSDLVSRLGSDKKRKKQIRARFRSFVWRRILWTDFGFNLKAEFLRTRSLRRYASLREKRKGAGSIKLFYF